MSSRDACGKCDVGTRRLLQGQPDRTNLFFLHISKLTTRRDAMPSRRDFMPSRRDVMRSRRDESFLLSDNK